MSEINPVCPWCGEKSVNPVPDDRYCLRDDCWGHGVTMRDRAWNALPRPEPELDAPDGEGDDWQLRLPVKVIDEPRRGRNVYYWNTEIRAYCRLDGVIDGLDTKWRRVKEG